MPTSGPQLAQEAFFRTWLSALLPAMEGRRGPAGRAHGPSSGWRVSVQGPASAEGLPPAWFALRSVRLLLQCSASKA